VLPTHNSFVTIGDVVGPVFGCFEGEIAGVDALLQRFEVTEAKEFVALESDFEAFVLDHGELLVAVVIVPFVDEGVLLGAVEEL